METLRLICMFGEREQWLMVLQQHLAVCDAALGMYPVGGANLMTSCHVIFNFCYMVVIKPPYGFCLLQM